MHHNKFLACWKASVGMLTPVLLNNTRLLNHELFAGQATVDWAASKTYLENVWKKTLGILRSAQYAGGMGVLYYSYCYRPLVDPLFHTPSRLPSSEIRLSSLLHITTTNSALLPFLLL
jgi:hypothetical protein